MISFVSARTWTDSQRIVEQHPELLRDAAEALLEQLDAAQPDAEAVRVLQEHRRLLHRCRDVGISQAFAERQLSAEQTPPEVRDVLAELTAGGIGIRTRKELEQALAARPDLRARLVQAVQRAADGPAVPPEFADDQRMAQEAEQRYLRTGDQAALDREAAACSRILEHAAFSLAPPDFRLGVLNDAGITFVRLYQERGGVDDLTRALDLFGHAVEVMPPDSPDLPAILNNLGAIGNLQQWLIGTMQKDSFSRRCS